MENVIDIYDHNEHFNNEFYLAPVYNYAIARGDKFGIYNIEQSQMHGTGTPEDLDKYIEIRRAGA